MSESENCRMRLSKEEAKDLMARIHAIVAAADQFLPEYVGKIVFSFFIGDNKAITIAYDRKTGVSITSASAVIHVPCQ